MSIVTLNTQSLTFACRYNRVREVSQSERDAGEFNFFTDGKGNILSKAEDSSYIYVDCEKRTVWCNMTGGYVPTFNAVMTALEAVHPALHEYIMIARRGREDTTVLLERALASLPEITIPMKTFFRMERGNFKSIGQAEMDLVNNFGTFDHRSLQGFRMIGFTEDGSVAPVFERVRGSKTIYYQDFSDVRYGLIALHYTYSSEYPEPNPDEKDKVAVAQLRKLLGDQDKLRLASFRVRADGAVRVHPRGVGASRWLSKLDIAKGSEFIFNNGLEHVLQPLGTEWDRGYTMVTFPLPTKEYYLRYSTPSLNGGLTTRNTRHSVLFKLDEDGMAQPLDTIKDMKKGDTVYRLLTSMRQGTNRSSIADCAEFQVKKPQHLGGGNFHGYYQSEAYLASEDHRLTFDGKNGATHAIASMNPSMLAHVLVQWEKSQPELYREITFEQLVPQTA